MSVFHLTGRKFNFTDSSKSNPRKSPSSLIIRVHSFPLRNQQVYLTCFLCPAVSLPHKSLPRLSTTPIFHLKFLILRWEISADQIKGLPWLSSAQNCIRTTLSQAPHSIFSLKDILSWHSCFFPPLPPPENLGLLLQRSLVLGNKCRIRRVSCRQLLISLPEIPLWRKSSVCSLEDRREERKSYKETEIYVWPKHFTKAKVFNFPTV